MVLLPDHRSLNYHSLPSISRVQSFCSAEIRVSPGVSKTKAVYQVYQILYTLTLIYGLSFSTASSYLRLPSSIVMM